MCGRYMEWMDGDELWILTLEGRRKVTMKQEAGSKQEEELEERV
jgi:hypothetical protein